MRLLLGAFLHVFGLFNVGFNVGVSSKWIVLTIAVYLVPLLGQLLPVRMIHAAALWFGFFLVVQSFLSPLIPVSDFRTLPVLMERQIDVISGAVPGIEGIQRITTDRLGFRVTPPVDYTADDTPGERYLEKLHSTVNDSLELIGKLAGVVEDLSKAVGILADRVETLEKQGRTITPGFTINPYDPRR